MANECYRSGDAKTPSDRYKNLGQGVVTDTQTGLTWMRCPIGMKWTNNNCTNKADRTGWSMSTVAISELNDGKGYANYNDWRLPTLQELNSLVEKNCFEPAINSEIFPNTPHTGFWTSTEESNYSHGAWLVYFRHGSQYMGNKEFEWALRAVRK